VGNLLSKDIMRVNEIMSTGVKTIAAGVCSRKRHRAFGAR
jgi:hypothetical protein